SFSFSPGESREARITLEGGRCTAIAAIVGRGLGRMQLSIPDAAGEFLARGMPRNSASIAIVCPPARETVLARMRAEVGTGEAALQTFTGVGAPAWAAGIDRVALSEALA